MIIAVDYDGTLDEAGFPNVGKPFMDRVNTCINWKKQGIELILWTCRSGESLKAAVDYMRTLGLEFDAVNENVERNKKFQSPKVVANLYIDDAAITADTFFGKQGETDGNSFNP